MKKLILILSMLALSFSVALTSVAQEQPQEPDEETLKKLSALVGNQIPTDLQTQLAQTTDGYCGVQGEFWLVVLRVKKFEQDKDSKEVKEVWPAIKIYGVGKADLAGSAEAKLIDLDTCPGESVGDISSIAK